MKKIKNFSQFDNLDFISESRVYFMNDLFSHLRDLFFDGNEWAGKLIQAQGQDIDPDVTFLNLDGNDFTFSRQSDLKKVINSDDWDSLFVKEIDERQPQRIQHYIGGDSQSYIDSLQNRGRAKIGKVIRKILADIPDKELENLVNSLRSEQSGFEFKLVKGDDIAKYYKKSSCDPKLLNYGTLQSSCMMDKSDEKPYIFDIYTKNPDTCQLAVMLNSSGQLVGRALVWKIDEVARWDDSRYVKTAAHEKENKFNSNLDLDWQRVKVEGSDNDLIKGKTKNLYFMDRVYYTKDWINNAFQKWAKDNGFMQKGGRCNRTSRSVSYKSELANPKLFVKVNKIAYRQFPYMDTFKNYEVQSATLCNYEMTGRGFNLDSTSGYYHAKGSTYQTGIDKATNYIRRVKDIF